MPLHCSCIDMQTHTFDFFISGLSLEYWLHKYSPSLFISSFSRPDIFLTVLLSFPALQFSFLCSSLFLTLPQLLVCCNYDVGVKHCFSLGATSLAADGFVVCSLVTSWLCDETRMWRVDRWGDDRVTTWLCDELTGSRGGKGLWRGLVTGKMLSVICTNMQFLT